MKQSVLSLQEEVDGMFGDSEPNERGEEEEASGLSCKGKRQALEAAPGSVKINVLDRDIEVKTPSSWKQSELLVPIGASTLTTLCDYIMQDVFGCFSKEFKRSYQQTGNFSKKAKGPESSMQVAVQKELFLPQPVQA